MTILDRIVEHKRYSELPRRKHETPQEVMQARAATASPVRDFVAALRAATGVALIAEVKRASPSRGVLCADFDPVRLAEIYASNGAAAISVLTDEAFFGGSLTDLSRIRADLTPNPSSERREEVPLLRKDFIVDPYQVYEARAAGADALLLIAGILGDEELGHLLTLTQTLGMTALVEVRDREELRRVLPLAPRLIGVNNRNLRDFTVDLGTCLALRPVVPKGICFVAESGIQSATDVARLAAGGVDAMLVGEALVTAGDVDGKVRELAHAGKG